MQLHATRRNKGTTDIGITRDVDNGFGESITNQTFGIFSAYPTYSDKYDRIGGEMLKISRKSAWSIDLSIANHLSCVAWGFASEGLLIMKQSALSLLCMKG